MKIEDLHHESHPHPLLFIEDGSNFYCTRCDQQEVLGPCFSCAECGFYLHKRCAEAPMQIDGYPVHDRGHTLKLRPIPSYLPGNEDIFCDLCWVRGKGFMYSCSSCEFFLHINCALLPRDEAGNFIETSHGTHPHPLILLSNDNNNLKRSCFCRGCLDPVTNDASYACFRCQFFLHKKCLELPIEIDQPYHRKHQLILKLDQIGRVCNLCERRHWGFFYCCSVCNVDIHSKCAFPPSTIEDASYHKHPFTLLLRPKSSNCDACGDLGNNVLYECSECNIQVHRKCISLPLIIGINLHHHPLYRNFFIRLPLHDSRTWDCQICFQKVNVEHGSYYCSKPDCNFVIHVNCAMDNENRDWFGVIELKNQDEVEKHFERLKSLYNKYGDCIIYKINIGEDGIAAEIKHISHGHNLSFCKESKDKKYCNGCILPILSTFYYCSICDFFLHKDCAELPRRLLRLGAYPFDLHINGIFTCFFCQHVCSGFFYKTDGADDDRTCCLRCASLPYSFRYQAHEPQHIFFDAKYKRHCSACGIRCRYLYAYRSKDGDFALDMRCLTLPRTIWHKCDEHSLTFAYQDDNDYPPQHYCDICEKRRDPKHWFYQCKDCNTAAHVKCVLGEYPFIKLGTKYSCKKYSHPLTFVQKMYCYPQCDVCDEPCEDLSLEHVEHDCHYIAHWECIQSDSNSDNDSE